MWMLRLLVLKILFLINCKKRIPNNFFKKLINFSKEKHKNYPWGKKGENIGSKYTMESKFLNQADFLKFMERVNFFLELPILISSRSEILMRISILKEP